MRLSFKYKFILSFVIIEIFFISLIVFYNFTSFKNLSNSLINTNIESSSRLFAELIKTPLITNDLATIDNAIESFSKMDYVSAIRIFNSRNILISHKNDRNPRYREIFDSNIPTLNVEGKIFQLKSIAIKIEDTKFADVQILYELSDIYKIIKDNRDRTFFLIILEIMLSTFIAYFIGYKLTKRLSSLTLSAKEISDNHKVYIPKDESIVDEVSILTNAMYEMQNKIFERNNQLQELIKELKNSSSELKKERDFHTALINNSSSAIIVLNNQYKIHNINDTVKYLTGYSETELKNMFIWEILSDDSIKSITLNEDINNYPKEYEHSLISKYQTNAIYTWSNSFVFNEFDDVEYIISVGIDISEVKNIQRKLEKYITLVNENIIISRTNLDGIITDVSEAFCKISGFKKEELIGQSHVIMRHEDTPIETYENLWKTIKNGDIWKSEVKNKTKDGNFYWTDSTIYPDYDNFGNITGYFAIRHDITNKKFIENLSITDSLTKLYNRRYFDDIFYKELHRAKRDKTIFCLLSLDVDYFKLYNDTYGHQEGDYVLQKISKVLMQNLKRPSDFAFRMGGEEFSAIFTISEEKNIYEFSENIRKSIEDLKIEHKKNIISPFVTISIGVVFINFNKNNGMEVSQSKLYKFADELLYKAKNQGRNRVYIEEWDNIS